MNKLNLQLQGKGQFINQMYDYITAFVNKLRFWQTQLIDSNFAHFPNLGLCKRANSDKYVSVIVSTKIQLESRFCDMKNKKTNSIYLRGHFQLMSIVRHMKCRWKLQSSNMLKAKYDSVQIANFYKKCVQKSTYPHLHDNAKREMCMFGSTCCCEQLFSLRINFVLACQIII